MFHKLTKLFLYAIVITLAVISTVAVYAAFIAPSDTPATSIQDWIGNALGANNANNAYDSSSVTGNHDGSLLERAEDLRKTLADNAYDSSFATANANGSVLQILKDIKASLVGGRPSGWTCTVRTNQGSYYASVSCVGYEKAVSGGCIYAASREYAPGGGPLSSGQGWYCESSISQTIKAIANCCL